MPEGEGPSMGSAQCRCPLDPGERSGGKFTADARESPERLGTSAAPHGAMLAPRIVRPETAADHSAIRSLVVEPMRPQESELVDLILCSEHHVPELSLAADDEIVGYVVLATMA
jgi:hypothetical protein